MRQRGFEPDYSPDALAEASRLPPTILPRDARRDLRHLLWASIDNDDSRDLDQLSVAEAVHDGLTTILVAIADVDAAVARGDAIDRHAETNTTSVYTAGGVFPMLPERLSTDITSLVQDEDRAAVVIELGVAHDGSVRQSDVYFALVRNRAKLAYGSVGAWLEGRGAMPPPIAAVPGLAENLKQQDSIAQALKQLRHAQGALTLQSTEARAVFDADVVRDLVVQERNRATELIEDFMIAANVATAHFLAAKQCPSLRRVVRVPKRWPRLVALAAETGDRLPPQPDARALEAWLLRRQAADPDHFPDLSLNVVKLLGRGEYVVERPGEPATGHFGLAVHDYTHATAPNRRFSDLVTERLIKAALGGQPSPYREDALTALAAHCTEREDAANRVERQVRKSAAALLLASRIGDTFDAIVTGVNPDGTWVRVRRPPVEGRLDRLRAALDVGDTLRVRLQSVNAEKAYVDFVPT
jgi:exoribonuclease-2